MIKFIINFIIKFVIKFVIKFIISMWGLTLLLPCPKVNAQGFLSL